MVGPQSRPRPRLGDGGLQWGNPRRLPRRRLGEGSELAAVGVPRNTRCSFGKSVRGPRCIELLPERRREPDSVRELLNLTDPKFGAEATVAVLAPVQTNSW